MGTSAATGVIITDTLIYTPTLNWHGDDNFTYRVYDGLAYSPFVPVTLIVSAVNDAPVAQDDAFTVIENSTDNALDVLSNDSDVDGGLLTIHVIGAAEHGWTMLGFMDNNILYTPDAGFFGTDTFTYTISDGNGGFDTGTVIVLARTVRYLDQTAY